MRKKLIAALGLLGVSGAFACAMVLGASSPGADATVHALGCRLINGQTICR